MSTRGRGQVRLASRLAEKMASEPLAAGWQAAPPPPPPPPPPVEPGAERFGAAVGDGRGGAIRSCTTGPWPRPTGPDEAAESSATPPPYPAGDGPQPSGQRPWPGPIGRQSGQAQPPGSQPRHPAMALGIGLVTLAMAGAVAWFGVQVQGRFLAPYATWSDYERPGGEPESATDRLPYITARPMTPAGVDQSGGPGGPAPAERPTATRVVLGRPAAYAEAGSSSGQF